MLTSSTCAWAQKEQKESGPELSEGPAPIVILIHGAMGPELPVRPKDWGIYQSYGRLMAASGLVAIAYNHRAGFPKVELQAASAVMRDVIRFARAGAAKWGADGERICMAAFSGGGPLLALAMHFDTAERPRPLATAC